MYVTAWMRQPGLIPLNYVELSRSWHGVQSNITTYDASALHAGSHLWLMSTLSLGQTSLVVSNVWT